MISWIVASHDRGILNGVLGPTLAPFYSTWFDDELVVIEGAGSITEAYAEGQQMARHSIKCYIHHDVKILDLINLRSQIIRGVNLGGMVGVVGSRAMVLPWWHGDLLGSVLDRGKLLNFGGGGKCAVVDGMLLATQHHVEWDLSAPGWHGYEYDACTQFLREDTPNWCIFGGHLLVHHISDSPYDLGQVDGWDAAVAFYQDKWGS